MKKRLITFAVATALSVALAADANAWTRSGSVTTARGTGSVQASGHCAGGSCSRSITRTGPQGNSVTRSGSVSCAGGTCSGSRTTTGPHGGSVTRSGTVSRGSSLGYPSGGVAAGAVAGFAVGTAVSATATPAPYIAPAPVYVRPPVVYVPRPVAYVRPVYYPHYYWGTRAYYAGRVAYYRF